MSGYYEVYWDKKDNNLGINKWRKNYSFVFDINAVYERVEKDRDWNDRNKTQFIFRVIEETTDIDSLLPPSEND